jgi:hypothetical protein
MALPATVPHQNLQSGAGILSLSKGFVVSSAERCLRSEVTVPHGYSESSTVGREP